MGSYISPMASRILFFKASIVFDCSPQIIVKWCQIAAVGWPNDISSAADNMIFKNRAQNIVSSFGCVACSAVLLKPNINFYEQKFFQHGPITIAIVSNGLSLLIFEEKLPNYAAGLKSATNSGSFWVGRLFIAFCAPNSTILLVYSPRSKWASSEKMICFAKIGFHRHTS